MAYYKCGKIFATQNSNTSIETSSGAIANFNTSLAMPVLGCKVAFSASQASGTPTPFAPIPIVGVDKVNITRTGKNLFNPNTTENEWVTVQNVITTSPASKSMRMKCTSGDSITISCINATSGTNILLIGTLNANGEVTSRSVKANGDTSLIKTASTNDKYFLIAFYNYANTGGGQLELGSTATAYEAYNGVTATINLGGTYYGGAVDAVTGKISVSKDVITFSGSESWSYHSSGFFYTTTQITNYKTNNAVIASNGIKIRLVIGGTYAVIRVYVSDNTDYIDSSTNMQTIMTNGIQAPYELDTPETEYASNTAEIPTLNGLNQVYADSGDVEVKYRRLHNDL